MQSVSNVKNNIMKIMEIAYSVIILSVLNVQVLALIVSLIVIIVVKPVYQQPFA